MVGDYGIHAKAQVVACLSRTIYCPDVHLLLRLTEKPDKVGIEGVSGSPGKSVRTGVLHYVQYFLLRRSPRVSPPPPQIRDQAGPELRKLSLYFKQHLFAERKNP